MGEIDYGGEGGCEILLWVKLIMGERVVVKFYYGGVGRYF